MSTPAPSLFPAFQRSKSSWADLTEEEENERFSLPQKAAVAATPAAAAMSDATTTTAAAAAAAAKKSPVDFNQNNTTWQQLMAGAKPTATATTTPTNTSARPTTTAADSDEDESAAKENVHPDSAQHSDDDMDGTTQQPAVARKPRVIDPELDSSRDGVPLLFKQLSAGSAVASSATTKMSVTAAAASTGARAPLSKVNPWKPLPTAPATTPATNTNAYTAAQPAPAIKPAATPTIVRAASNPTAPVTVPVVASTAGPAPMAAVSTAVTAQSPANTNAAKKSWGALPPAPPTIPPTDNTAVTASPSKLKRKADAIAAPKPAPATATSTPIATATAAPSSPTQNAANGFAVPRTPVWNKPTAATTASPVAATATATTTTAAPSPSAKAGGSAWAAVPKGQPKKLNLDMTVVPGNATPKLARTASTDSNASIKSTGSDSVPQSPARKKAKAADGAGVDTTHTKPEVPANAFQAAAAANAAKKRTNAPKPGDVTPSASDADTDADSMVGDDADGDVADDGEGEAEGGDATMEAKGAPPRVLSPEARLRQRQRQIDLGKKTPGYQTFVSLIPKNKRVKGMPRTPDKHSDCSKRSWDGQVRKWRRLLHEYDNATLVTGADGKKIVKQHRIELPTALAKSATATATATAMATASTATAAAPAATVVVTPTAVTA